MRWLHLTGFGNSNIKLVRLIYDRRMSSDNGGVGIQRISDVHGCNSRLILEILSLPSSNSF